MSHTPPVYFKDEDSDRVLALDESSILNILSDLKGDRKELEDQRAATLNILEDITEAQEELQMKYKQTKVLQDLLQELTLTNDPKELMENMLHSFKKLLNFDVTAFLVGEYKSKEQASTMYVYTKTLIGRSYMESMRRAFLEYFEQVPVKTKNVERLKNQLRGRLFYEFISGSMGPEEDLGRMPVNGFVVPLLLKEKEGSVLLGAFYISTISRTAYKQTEIEIANDIASLVSFNVERINTMVRSEYARMSNLVDSMTNGVIVFNKAHTVTLANPMIEKMTGLPCSSSSSSSSSLFHLEELGRLFPKLTIEKMASKVLETGLLVHVKEAKLSRFFYEIVITPIRDHTGTITGGAIILHDVTHTKEVDRMKTEFVSIASHQLRTPLTAIKLFIEMLAQGEVGALSNEQGEYVNNIAQSTERMIHLVNDLLNVSRLETGRLKIEPTLTQLEEFIQNILDETKPLAEKKLCVIQFIKPEKPLPLILIDTTLFGQVIHNMLTNAIKYSPHKECEVMVTLGVQDDDFYVVSVKDSGLGIPRKMQSRIFQKFFRADNAVKAEAEGSGLGLYVAKMILGAVGGKIWFESEEGKGTTFYATIPKSGMKKKSGERTLA